MFIAHIARYVATWRWVIKHYKKSIKYILAFLVAILPAASRAYARAGTEITSSVSASFDFGSERLTIHASQWIDIVDELVDVEVRTLETDPVAAGAGSSNQVARFQISNLGNGDEAFSMSVENAVSGDQFDPEFASIWLDNGDGVFSSVSDVLYQPGQNEPVLGMVGDTDDQLTVFVLNHMPNSGQGGDMGISQLSVSSLSATGTGTVVDGAGDLGTDLVVGFTEGEATDEASYIIEQATVSAVKTVEVWHSDHGVLTEAIPGATLRYTIRISVEGLGSVENVIFRDPIPSETQYTPGTLFLNGNNLTDPSGDDAGEFDDLNNEVVARLGRLSAADGEQVIVFETIMKEVQP